MTRSPQLTAPSVARFVTLGVATALACGGRSPVGTAVAAPTVPSGFALQTVVGEPFASDPVGFAFLPDGRIVLIEKDSGNVRLAAAGSSTSALIFTVPNVTPGGERGLLGVAVDPQWPARPYLYFHSTQAGDVIHITRYTASGQLTNPASTAITLGSPFVLMNDILDLFANHNGGTLRFGPDGHLYVSIGEDSRGCDAQDLTILRGKILRLKVSGLPDGAGGPPAKSALTPADNPFPGADANERLVYAFGLRNPFRFTIDPRTNDLFIGDVGYNTWEEMDELVYAGYTGNNYGWPEWEGTLQDPDPATADCSTGPFVAPIYVYPNPPGPPVAAVTGGPLYRPNPHSTYSFPRAYDGDLFLCEFYAGWMRRLVRSGGGWALASPVPGQPDATNWATNLGNVADAQVGPDGALYLLVMVNGGFLPRGLNRIVNTLPSDVSLDPAGAPSLFAAPNPARTGVGLAFRYRLARGEPVTIRVFDLSGRLVRTLQHPPAARDGALHWDGRTARGTPAPSGLYAYELQTPSGTRAHGKVTLAR